MVTERVRSTERLRLEHLRATLPSELAQFCSPREFAAILRVSVKTVYAWLSEGRLDSVSQKFGRHRRILTVPALELLFAKPNWSK